MATAKQEAIWINRTFGVDIDRALVGTPISKNLIIAIGIQETFYIWGKMYKKIGAEEVLAVCVGDTIDFPKRKTAWPKNRKELERHRANRQAQFCYKVAARIATSFATALACFSTTSSSSRNFPTSSSTARGLPGTARSAKVLQN